MPCKQDCDPLPKVRLTEDSGDLHRTVAVQLVLVTVEDPGAELVLRAEEAGLVVAGVRAEEREAVQRLPLGRPVELQSPALHDARHEVSVRDLREELPGRVALQGARVGELAAVSRVPGAVLRGCLCLHVGGQAAGWAVRQTATRSDD